VKYQWVRIARSMVKNTSSTNAGSVVVWQFGSAGNWDRDTFMFRGSTHFCEPCHKRQVDGDYVSKYTKDKLPKCPGKDKCPLQIDHKPNGDESALGCCTS
jgi:hypothetical protein